MLCCAEFAGAHQQRVLALACSGRLSSSTGKTFKRSKWAQAIAMSIALTHLLTLALVVVGPLNKRKDGCSGVGAGGCS
jgi:hypothetical protein